MSIRTIAMGIVVTAGALGLSATSASAQDQQYYSESLNDSARLTRERMLRDATVNRGQRRSYAARRGGSGVSAKTRQTCAARDAAAAEMGRNHPDIRALYALCARAGL